MSFMDNKERVFTYEEVDFLLQEQVEEVRQFVDRCARDKGMANAEFNQWISETPLITIHK